MSCEGCNKCQPLMKGVKYDSEGTWMSCAQEEFKYDPEEYSYPTAVLLGVTSRCNLSCSYCFVHQKPEDMSYETAERAVEMARENAKHKGETATVVFFGGEPLLRFDDIIKPIVEKYSDVVYSITTNGMLLDEDKVDFFNQYDVAILLSFDGIAEVQNTQRPAKVGSSFEQVLKNIPYLLVRFPETTMRATITKESVKHLYECYLAAEEIGFKHSSFAVNGFEEWDLATANEFQHQMDMISTHIMKYLMNTKTLEEPCSFDVFNGDLGLIHDFKYAGAVFPNALYRCGLGTSTFSVCPNGDIVPCQERVSNPTWVIGNVYRGYDREKHEEFLRWYWDHVNSLSCDRSCREDIRVFCFSRNICPARLEDLDFKLSTSICYSTQVAYRCAARIFKLIDHSILPKYQEFFKIRLKEREC